MQVAKLPRPVLVLLTVVTTLTISCSEPGIPLPSKESEPYSTHEIVLKETGYPTAFWEGKIVYDATTGSGDNKVTRIVEHDLATGRETILIEAQPPHTSAYSVQRSGEWLFYYESHTVVSVPPVFEPPRDFYAFNLRTGQRQDLPVLQRADWHALGASAFWENGFAYLTNSNGRRQLRVYNIESGEDRLLLETETGGTWLWSPMLRGNKVIFSMAWQSEWPPGVTPTPMPGRPGPWPPRYQKTGDIFSLDMKTGERVNLSNTGSASDPAIWGDYLMWIDQPAGGGQEYGSGEVYVLNIQTGQLKKLTSDATYMHLYSSPMAGEGFFVWGDAHQQKNRLPVYLPESDEMIHLEGPGGDPQVYPVHTDGKILFWAWAEATTSQNGAVNDRRPKVYMTTFE